jgi:hypothetical protein
MFGGMTGKQLDCQRIDYWGYSDLKLLTGFIKAALMP